MKSPPINNYDDGQVGDSKTAESMPMRMSLLEPNARSSMNHESHHDQNDYDSQMRTQILNQVPTLSPYLMGQLTSRLELENKLQDHKKLLKSHFLEPRTVQLNNHNDMKGTTPDHRQQQDKAIAVTTQHLISVPTLGSDPVSPVGQGIAPYVNLKTQSNETLKLNDDSGAHKD